MLKTKNIILFSFLTLILCEQVKASELTSSFCKKNQLAERVLSLGLKSSKIIQNADENLELLEKSKNGTEDYSPWDGAVIPSLNVRYSIYKNGIVPIFNKLRRRDKINLESLQNALKDFKSTDIYLTFNRTNLIDAKDLSSYETYNENIKQGLLKKAAICADFNKTSITSCVSSLENIIEFMKPYGFKSPNYPAKSPKNLMNINGINLIRKILKNKEIKEGIYLTASKMILNLYTFEKTGNLLNKSKNIFTDLVENFKSTGLNNEIATEFAWDILGLFGTRGANIYLLMQFTDGNDDAFLYTLTLLFQAAAVLDSIAFKNHQSYSYPDGVLTTCDFGKPYHFWLTAYLSREESNKNHKKVGSSFAAYISNVGYQMISKTSGRDPNRTFLLSDDSPGNQKIRMDLAFSAAGAVFGVNSTLQNKNTIDVDLILDQLLSKKEKVTPLKSLSEAEGLWTGFGIEAYQRWIEIFVPKKAIDEAWRQINL